jgi:hypothetical protein
MKTMAFALSIALSAVAVSASLAPVSATRMNGKCCTSSDGGRSYRYRMALRRAAIPHTCSAYAASCIRDSSTRPDRSQMCRAAKAECVQTGVYVGPYSRREFHGMQKI